MKGYVCIHGHFYQPPRENPWLEAIEIQNSAHPYHDWNERVAAESYAPNAYSRILDGDERIAKITNNYARMSFNFGPTLLSWLESRAPGVYHAILEADRVSRKNFSGHGSAMAQIYNHMIMPLATGRQKSTQARWAIEDFKHRFARSPEGMWLPETAVDLETLEVLAGLDIEFTILAPSQARRWRRTGETIWSEVTEQGLDTTRPYLARLPSGRSMAVFFYDAQISRAVAFERLLNSGDNFANRLLRGLTPNAPHTQLVHIATDGETYGHHHRYGEMALAYAIKQIEASTQASLTNYGEFLERFPPIHEVEIRERTAWSCAHGIDRWRTHCGCSVSHRPGWSQHWRASLRSALDWLEAELSPRYEQCGQEYLRDPWKAQDSYIQVILDRSPETLEIFLDKHAVRPLNHEERVTVLKLLEIQRHAMLMFTSCGWFFDDISGIESVQNLLYAARSVQLAQEVYGVDLEGGLLSRLEPARSNLPEQVDGRRIYENQVKPAITDLKKVAAHYALSSLFESYPETADLYCYTVYSGNPQKLRAGRARMSTGQLDISSNILLETATFTFCAMHFGEHNATAGVREFQPGDNSQPMLREINDTFKAGDLLRTVRLLDRQFQGGVYSLKQLFRDEQHKITGLMLRDTLREVEEAYYEIYEPNVPLMRFLEDLGIPLPRGFDLAAQFVLSTRLRRAIQKDPVVLSEITALLQEAKTRRISLDTEDLSFQLRQITRKMGRRFQRRPGDASILARLAEVLKLVQMMPFPVVLWDLENVVYEVLQARHPIMKKRAERGDETALAWLSAVEGLARELKITV